MGNYSIAFDTISQEYGWTDEQILDLTLVRFRQILAAINRRKFLRRREEIALVSWQTRQLATFTAGGYMVDSKKGNPALDAAQVLHFDEIEKYQIEEAIERDRNRTPDDHRFGNPADPKPGSFERFMGSMGNPFRWAGR